MPSQNPDFDDTPCFSCRRTRGIRLWSSRGPWGPKKSRTREILNSRSNSQKASSLCLCVTGPRSNCSAHLLMANYFNAGKTKNGHETGPQGPDFGLDPRTGHHFSRRIRFRPPRGPGRPKKVRKSPGKFPQQINVFVFSIFSPK